MGQMVYRLVDKHQVRFTPVQGSVNQILFKGGNTYYFYTTSNGSEAGLGRNRGPASTRHMFFKVRVCGSAEICDDLRLRVNRCLQPMVARPQVSDGLQRKKLINETFLTFLLVLTLTLGILIGVLAPCIFGHLKRKYQHSVETVDDSSSSFTPKKGSSKQISTLSYTAGVEKQEQNENLMEA